MSGTTFIESSSLVLLRAALFFSCRKYLLHSLYSDLQDLSETSNASNTIPMRDPLPSPITQTEREKPNRRAESVYSRLSSAIFAGCFSESCLLFILLMLQGLNILGSSTRLFNWRLSMFLLLTCILVLVPLTTSILLTVGPDLGPRTRSIYPRIIFSSICVAVYLFCISLVPLPDALSTTDRMTATFSRLIVLGTIILGLLAGFGAASSAWTFVLSRKIITTPSEQDVVSAEYSLSNIRDDLERRRSEASKRAAAQQSDGTWLSRMMPSFRGDEYLQEVKGLEALEYQMSRNVDDLRQRRAAAKFSRTFQGRLLNVGGRLFALYCIFRYLTCLVNVFIPFSLTSPSTTTQSAPSTGSYRDIVTESLVHLLANVHPAIQPDDVARATRHVSLVLVGVIILSSIRLVLRGVTRALRVTSRNLGASLMLLLLAQLMLRSSFPPPSPSSSSSQAGGGEDTSTATDNLFSTIPDFQAFNSLFDWAFVLAATGALSVRWAASKVDGAGRD
ncbi:G protein-coupled receptor 89 [Favolaschia claudopus]|uniref:G protein-coupled receptor 89 n=1 Tax=Favolaschia claudopus TaxID=2862362 RepID=A0AAW0DU74_9AGAR